MTGKSIVKKFIPPLALFIIMLIVFFPLLSGGTYLISGVLSNDQWLFNYPLKEFYREMLLQNKLPLWTSLIGNGYPIFAEGQVGALYPFNLILFRLFSAMLAYNINIIIHFVMAALFTYLYARNLNLSQKASFLSAITYSLSGFMVIHIHQININMVITYLPLALLSVDKILAGKRSWFSVLTMSFVMEILAGHIEMFYYCLGITGIYFVLRLFIFPLRMLAIKTGPNTEKYSKNDALLNANPESIKIDPGNGNPSHLSSIAIFIAAIICALGITFLQLSATYELNQQSQRSEGLNIEHATATVWPLETLEIFVNPRKYELYRVEEEYTPTGDTVNTQGLYGYVGIIPLFLAFSAIFFTRKKITILFSTLMVLAFFYGMGRSTQLFAIFWNLIPGLKFFRFPTKILFLIEFCLAILAGIGLDNLTSSILKKRGVTELSARIKKSTGLLHITGKTLNMIAFILLAVSLTDLLYFNAFGTRKIINANDWLSVPESAQFLSEKIGDPYQYRIYGHGMSNIDYSYATNEKYQKVFRNMLPIDFNMIYKIPTNQEWAVLFLERQSKLNGEKTRVDFEKGTISLNPLHKKALALQAVRYIVSDVVIVDPDLTELKKIPFPTEVNHVFYVSEGAGMSKVQFPVIGVHIYENKYFYPRVNFVADFEKANNPDDALKSVLDPEFDPTKSVVLEASADDRKLPEENAKGGVIPTSDISITKDGGDVVAINVKTNLPGILVLSDTYYPGWHAFVDGKEVGLFRANYAFRGVEVGSGEHTVIMEYKPTYWMIGKTIFLGSLVLFGIVWVGIWGWGRKKNI